MKREKRSNGRKATTFIRIDSCTWIEKRIDEPDEVARQRFLMKLSRAFNNTVLRPAL